MSAPDVANKFIRPTRCSMLLLLASFAPLLSGVPSQVTVIDDRVVTPPDASSMPLGLHEAQGGGVFVLETPRPSSIPGLLAVTVHRLDERGDAVWSTVLPRTPGAISASLAQVMESPSGGVAIAFSELLGPLQTTARVVRITAGGAVMWDVDLRRPGTPPALVEAIGIGESESGDILVGGWTAGPVRDVWVRAFDPLDGAELWEHRTDGAEQPTMVPALGGAYLGYSDTTNSVKVLELVDSGGAVTWRLAPPVPSAAPFGPVRVLAALPDGSAIITQALPSGSSDLHRLARVGPDGTVLWSQENVRFPGLSPRGIGPGGEIALTTQDSVSVGDRSPLRLGPDGTTLWDVPAPAKVGFYRDGIDLGDGTVGFLCDVVDSGTGLWSGALHLVDGTGTTQGIPSLLPPARPPIQSRFSRQDDRGQLWTSFRDNSDPAQWVTRVSRAVIGNYLGALICEAPVPNSLGRTGALLMAGSAVAADDNLTLIATGLPVGVPMMFLNGDSTGSAPAAGGSLGTLCLGGGIGRYDRPGEIRFSDDLGVAALRTTLPSTPRPTGTTAALAGQVLYFQAWYRDTAGGVSVSNFTGARGIRFM